MTDYAAMLQALAHAGVKFIVVGGLAATAHGAARVTYDLDVVYARDPANIANLIRALKPHHPSLRGAPEGVPFTFDERSIRSGLNFTFSTDLGEIDILGEIAGGGSYEDIVPHSFLIELFGITCRCLELDKLIEVKRAAGRPKDFEAIAELEAIREERDKLA